MQPGEQLGGGRFTLEQQITRSGMAEVWLARQQVAGGMSKMVVVKMIHPDLNAQQEARQRFFDEARFMSQIHHPHVVQFYDFGEEDDDLLFQVMEYIEGFAIEQVIARSRELGRPVPIPIICRLIADACKGLGYIHDLKDGRGVNMELVHRDISPQNLLIANSGTIKIIDFGIAKAREKSSRTRTGVIVGKLQYMSPEQLSSEDLDSRSDIYSMGLVLFELLTLQARFRGSNLLEVFYEALNEPPPPVLDLRPDCPRELVQCVQMALTQDKESRFRNAYSMQEMLEAMLHRLGAPLGERQVASFLSELFVGAEALTEHTTQIHAASLLGGSYDDEVSEATVAALESSLLHGGGFGQEEGTFQSNPGFANQFQNHEVTSTEYQFSGLAGMGKSPGDHTMAPTHRPAPFGNDLGEHTLGGMSASFGTVEQTIQLPDYQGPVLDRGSHDPTRINAPMPSIPAPMAPMASVPLASPPGHYPPATPPPVSEMEVESVMISEALRAEAGSEIKVIAPGKPTGQSQQARASRPASPPPRSAQQAPGKSPSKKSFPLSSQAMMMIGLGFGAFVLGILMVIILLS